MINDRICPLSTNPRYFSYKGKPIWLSGHSLIWTFTAGLQGDQSADLKKDAPACSYRQEVADVAASGGHLFRITPFWPDVWKNNIPMPWEQVEPGRFDLSRFNEAYFDHLCDFIRLASENDIIIQMEIWDRPGLSHWHESRWPSHPFNPDRNINYGRDMLPGSDPNESNHVVFGRREFYRTVVGEKPELLKYQELYVNKLLSEIKEFPNLLYCIENEGQGGYKWERRWAKFIKDRIPDAVITAMPLDPQDNHWRDYFDDPLFGCLDGGGSGLRTAARGMMHSHEDIPPAQPRSRSDQFALIREYLDKYIMYMTFNPQTARPIYVSNAFGKQIDSIWVMFFGGAAGFRYHRCLWSGSNGDCYRWVKALNRFIRESGIEYWEMRPARDLLQGHGMCLAGVDRYGIYIPSTNTIRFRVPESAKTVTVRRFDCDHGEWIDETTLDVKRYQDGSTEMIELEGASETGTALFIAVKPIMCSR